MTDYKLEFAKLLEKAILKDEFDSFRIIALIERPPEKEMGDFSFPTFTLSKTFKKPPITISEELLNQLKQEEGMFTFSSVAGYVNAKVSSEILFSETISEVISKGKDYGKQELDSNQYVIDTFNANPLKVLHIGHLRNIVTGDAIYRLLKFVGADPIPVSYGGDIGTHVAKWYWYYQKLSPEEQMVPKKDVSKWFGSIYIKAGLLLETNEEVYKKEIDDLQVKIMNDEDLQNEIKILVKESHDAYMEIGCEMGVYLDASFFESNAEKEFIEMKDNLFINHRDVFIESEGAIVADLNNPELGKFILIKQNGAPLYGAKDIGLVKLKMKAYPKCNDFLYIIASEQDFYLKQLFTLFKLIYPNTNHFHISHGLVNSAEGKMKSREGSIFLYEDFRDELFSRVKDVLVENGLEIDEEIVKEISFGVIKFEMLKTGVNKNILFDLNAALDLQGDSAPYIQYSGVRAKSILKKTGSTTLKITKNLGHINLKQEERDLLSEISLFKEKVEEAYKDYRPNIIATYCLSLSRSFNKFYASCQVLDEDDTIKNNRLLLTKTFLITLTNALSILGINIPDKM